MKINKNKFIFIKFFLIIFFCFLDLKAQNPLINNPLSSEADPEQNFELKKIYQLSYDKKELYEDDLSPFKPRTPTPSRLFTADLSMPETFQTTNNLAKKPGSFYRAYGEIIFIQGTLTDSFGVPIHNAVIEIWQTNSAGKYHTLLEVGSGYIDKFFSMSGRAITDNLGNYHFISIMPGATAGRAPHINMNVYHPKFGKLETEMYFMNHPFNFTDYQYLSYPELDRKLITAEVRNTDILNPKSIKIITFNLVMKGIHQFKKF